MRSTNVVPSWVIRPFCDFHTDLDRDTITETVHQLGTHCLFEDPNVEQRLNACDGSVKGRTFRMAKCQGDADIPHLRKIMLIRLWSNIHYLVIGTVSNVIRNDTTLCCDKRLAEIRDNAKHVESADTEWYFERTEKVFTRVANSERETHRRFERLLALLNLPNSGSPPHTICEDSLRNLGELRAIRNCLVHYRGVVHKRLLNDAPSLAQTCTVGQPIPVDRLRATLYSAAVRQYAFSVYARIYALYGGTEADVQRDLLVGLEGGMTFL